MRAVIRSAYGQPDLQQTANITWLPPTAQNLGKLTVPIPAGFRQVPLAQAVWPILQQIPFGSPPTPEAFCPSPADSPGACFGLQPPSPWPFPA